MTPAEVDLTGLRDHKDPGIRYLGRASRQPNGEYFVLADVHGALCRVAVTLSTENPAARAGASAARDLILRLRTRLAIVEPVYRAALAAHRNGAPAGSGQHERVEWLECQVDRALEKERLLAEGHQLVIDEDES